VAEAGEKLGDSDVQKLMESYNTLNLFPDVPPVFDHLKAASNIHAVIFSNGDKAMISATMAESPEISPYASLFKDIVVVGPVKKFKPHMDTYTHLIKSVNKEEKPEDVWLISGNPFDIVGANHAGMSTCWVDRSGGGWADSLVEGDKGKPTVIVKGLNEVVEKIQAHSK
jgi:2-haloacid dehalogenase